MEKTVSRKIDIAGVTMPITKHNYIVKNVKILQIRSVRHSRLQKSRKTGTGADRYPERCDSSKAEYEPARNQRL